MISWWLISGLVLATISVSTLGAGFSVVGIGALFSGAMIAVYAMATSLELAKFVLAAYLHQRWDKLNKVFRGYLVFAIVVLSLITSMGIFGFLSDAYSSASAVLESENIKLDSFQKQLENNREELARLDKAIQEIPATRVTKRLQARAAQELVIADLNQKRAEIEQSITASNLTIIDVKKKVGPLIYISRAFKMDIDDVVKYLILVLVLVFDPLAICLVVATTEALNVRRLQKLYPHLYQDVLPAAPISESAQAPSVITPQPPAPKPDHPVADDPAVEEVLQMRFADDTDKNAG